MHVTNVARAICAILALVAATNHSSGGTISFTAVGTPSGSSLAVNVSATFKNVGNDLEVDVFSNSAATDPLQILSGLVWNVSGTAPTGTSLSSAVTAASSNLYASSSSSTPNAELRNSVLGGGNGWQYLAPPGQLNSVSYQFGFGSSGLNGTFGGLGNASYGIVGPGSSIGHVPVSNQLPLVMNNSTGASEAIFTIANFNADVSRIKNVTFAFGSAGTNNLVGVPEPASIVMAAICVTASALFAGSRRRNLANG